MIKEYGDKIEIYSSTDTTELKIRIIIWILGLISGIYMYITAHAYNVAFLIISLIMLVAIYINLKTIKKKKVQVLEAEITNTYIKFYKGEKFVKFKYSEIKNVSYDTFYSRENEIFVNYFDVNNKLNTAIFLITGCSKEKFADIANNIKESENDKNYNNKNNKEANYNNNEKIEKVSEKLSLYELLQSGEILKVAFLGKDKLLKKIGDNKYSLPQTSTFYFIDENGEKLELYLNELDIDDKELKVEGVYVIKYNKKYKCYTFEISKQEFDSEIFQKARNKLEYRNRLLFEDTKIQEEIKYEEIIYKLTKFNRYTMLLDLLLLLKYPGIGCVIFLVTLIVSMVVFENIRNKCKKIY